MIKLSHVNVNIKEEAILKDIDVEVRKGEFILITGRSGSGKSTLLKLINGLIPHFERAKVDGEIMVDGMTPKDQEIYEISRKVTSVFQNPKTSFFNTDTRLELIFYLENRGFSRDIMLERLKEAEDIFGITHLLDRSIFELSGGEKQILSLAAAYMTGCDIFVLDEPTSNLDENATKKIATMLRILKERKKTILLAEHRISFIKGIVDRVILLERGTISLNLPASDFFNMDDQERKRRGLRNFNPVPLKNTREPEGMDYKIEDIKIPFVGQSSTLEIAHIGFSKGTIIGIVGHNGVGKSTFIKALMAEPKGYGKVCLEGNRLTKKGRLQNSFLVMQDVNCELFTESVWEECRIGNQATKDDISTVLQTLRLDDLKDRHPMSLSGGQKQRLVIAAAILSKRMMLFFDEPTSGMDYYHMKKVSQALKELAKEGKIIVVITHDLELIEETCDVVLNMEKYKRS